MNEKTEGQSSLTIRDAVQTGLEGLKADGRIRNAVVEHYAGKEADKRAAALISGLDKLAEKEKTFSRIKPDVETFDETGKPVSSGYSKAKLEERNKLQQEIDKLRNAINKADELADYGDLYNLTKGGDGKKGEQTENN